MSETEVGPISTEKDCFGQSVRCYALKFDREGACLSPKSLQHLIDFLKADGASDVILFSHGWNNDWPTAQERYLTFLRGLSASAKEHGAVVPSGFRPVFLGIHWPSTILTWPKEDGPDIAADDGPRAEDKDGAREAIAALRDLLSDAEKDRFDAFVAKDRIDAVEAGELAKLLAPHILAVGDTGEAEEAEGGGFGPADLVEIWQKAVGVTADPGQGNMTGGGFDDFGGGNVAGGRKDGPAALGLLENLSPRNIVRLTTVLMMKDRAGVVGAGDVAKVVHRILDESKARLHLIGHSYGAKVVMTALVKAKPERPVQSVLLLQPAVSHLAFAADIGNGAPGGFRPALARVVRPIYATYSSNDFPLFNIFHWVARRRKDWGEPMAAGGPPSKYAALGGYGQAGMGKSEALDRSLPAPGKAYEAYPASTELVALNGATGITGHGDVTNPYTFWAMLDLLK